MAVQSKWVKCQMKCPEGRGEGHLFLHWHAKGEKKVLNAVRCDNMYLKDLSGGDCQWSCWEKVSEEE